MAQLMGEILGLLGGNGRAFNAADPRSPLPHFAAYQQQKYCWWKICAHGAFCEHTRRTGTEGHFRSIQTISRLGVRLAMLTHPESIQANKITLLFLCKILKELECSLQVQHKFHKTAQKQMNAFLHIVVLLVQKGNLRRKRKGKKYFGHATEFPKLRGCCLEAY